TAVQEFALHDSTSLGGLSGIGVASEVSGLGARHSGPQGDPNFWCRVLVLFLPLALALMWSRSDRAGTHRDGGTIRLRWAGGAGHVPRVTADRGRRGELRGGRGAVPAAARGLGQRTEPAARPPRHLRAAAGRGWGRRTARLPGLLRRQRRRAAGDPQAVAGA